MNLVMYASILSAIVLCLVGLIKLPLVRFKQTKFYKAGLTLLTIVIIIGLCMICQAYIIGENIISVSMLYLILITFGEVMLSYNGVYEGFGVKKLAKTLLLKVKELLEKSPESKLTKYAEKIGVNNALEIINNFALSKQKELEQQKEVTPEVAKEV